MADYRLITVSGTLVDLFTAAPYAEDVEESVALAVKVMRPHRQRARSSDAGVPDAYVLEESVSDAWEKRAVFYTGRAGQDAPTA